MGNNSSAPVTLSAGDIAIEDKEDVVLTNSDLEDTETNVPEERIPTWIRWVTASLPVVVGRTKAEQDADNAIEPLQAVYDISKMSIEDINGLETALCGAPVPSVVPLGAGSVHAPQVLNHDDINKHNLMPGSAMAMEANYLIAERILSENKVATSDKRVIWRIAVMGTICAYGGLTPSPILVGSKVFNEAWAPHLKSRPAATFARSKAITKLDAKIIVESFKAISALATCRWTRIHLLGAFARPADKSQASNSARTKERDSAIKSAQKSQDSIVARAAKLTGLSTNANGLAALYWVGKSLDLLAIVSAQFALNGLASNTSRGDQDPLRASLAEVSGGKTNSLSVTNYVRFYKMPVLQATMTRAIEKFSADAPNLSNERHETFIQWIAPPADLACAPRRDGGSATYRIAIRALERFSILSSNGGVHIAGLSSDGSALFRSMAPVVAAPQLFHPAFTSLFTGLAKIQEAVLNAPMRNAMSRINAGFASFEEARSEQAAYIASDVKAMGKGSNKAVVKALGAYGRMFRVIEIDSNGAKNLLKAATSGIGVLNPDASLEECKELLARGNAAFTSNDLFTETGNIIGSIVADCGNKEVSDNAFKVHAESYHPSEVSEDATKQAVTQLLAKGVKRKDASGGLAASVGTALSGVAGIFTSAAGPSNESLVKYTTFFEKDVALPDGLFAGLVSDIEINKNIQGRKTTFAETFFKEECVARGDGEKGPLDLIKSILGDVKEVKEPSAEGGLEAQTAFAEYASIKAVLSDIHDSLEEDVLTGKVSDYVDDEGNLAEGSELALFQALTIAISPLRGQRAAAARRMIKDTPVVSSIEQAVNTFIASLCSTENRAVLTAYSAGVVRRPDA